MNKATPMAALLRHITLTQRILRKADSRLSLHGVSFSEFQIMYYLDKAPEQTMRRIDLAQSVGLSASGVTRLLAPMTKNHLVEKRSNPRDARVSLVKLSDTGGTVLADVAKTLEYLAEDIFTVFTKTELNQLENLEAKLGV